MLMEANNGGCILQNVQDCLGLCVRFWLAILFAVFLVCPSSLMGDLSDVSMDGYLGYIPRKRQHRR